MKPIIPVLATLLLASTCFAQSDELAFTYQNERVVLSAVEVPKVIFKRPSGARVAFPFSKFNEKYRKRIMDHTGWGRVWEDNTGKHRTIADLVEVHEDTVTLQGINGKEFSVSLDRLSKADRKYAEARQSSDVLPDRFYAKVIAVTDGDTVKVLLNKRQYKIRLSGIDAPETGQAYGSKSKKLLSSLVFGKFVSGVTEDTDKYGRNVCTLSIEGKRTDYSMLEAGLAWHYVKYSSDSKRGDYEREAKEKKINLWSESGPIEPWEWRRWGSAKRKAWLAQQSGATLSPRPPPKSSFTSTTETKRPAVGIGSYWLNTNSYKRHNAGCRWYRNTSKGRMCSGSEGTGCKICGG